MSACITSNFTSKEIIEELFVKEDSKNKIEYLFNIDFSKTIEVSQVTFMAKRDVANKALLSPEIETETKIVNLIKAKIPLNTKCLYKIFKYIQTYREYLFNEPKYPVRFSGEIQAKLEQKPPVYRYCLLEIHDSEQIYLIFQSALIGIGGYKKIALAWQIYTAEIIAYAISDISTPMAKQVAEIEEKALIFCNGKTYTPNIYGVFRYEAINQHIMHMEYCPRTDLFSFIEPIINEESSTRSLPDTMKVRLGKQLIMAVQFLHDHGMLHRDIKPENVLLREENGEFALLLTDFGFSCKEDELNEDNIHVGSYPYLPYEMFFALPKALVNGKAKDMWGVGCVLHLFWLEEAYKWYGTLIQQESEADIKIMLEVKKMMETSSVESIPVTHHGSLLIQKMLHDDVAQRLTATESLKQIETFEGVIGSGVKSLIPFNQQTKL